MQTPFFFFKTFSCIVDPLEYEDIQFEALFPLFTKIGMIYIVLDPISQGLSMLLQRHGMIYKSSWF